MPDKLSLYDLEALWLVACGHCNGNALTFPTSRPQISEGMIKKMSNLQWTERAGEGVTAQHKASVGKQQSWKAVKNLWIKYNFLKSKSNSLETQKLQRLKKEIMINQ